MIQLKTEKDIIKLREAGRRLASVLNQLVAEVKPGIITAQLNQQAIALIKELGDRPAFLNYRPAEAAEAYPAALCVSINDEIVHGLPTDRAIENGDLVTLDLGLNHQGYFTDMAITVAVGQVSGRVKDLMFATKEALALGIQAAQPGRHIGDIGFAIESYLKPKGFGIIKALAGHGVGFGVHEDPLVPNYGRPGRGEKLKPGMVLALEPMITLGSDQVILLDDGFTFATADGSISAHFEHTIVITDNGPEILTQ